MNVRELIKELDDKLIKLGNYSKYSSKFNKKDLITKIEDCKNQLSLIDDEAKYK